MLARKLSAALAAGCTAVSRPSEDVPLSTIALRCIATEAGLPQEAFIPVTSSRHYASAISDTMCTSEYIQAVSFTGSTTVGKSLVAKCAPQLKRVSMELGGNAPFIVFEDANLEAAVAGLMAAKLRFSGQTCVAANRVFVHASKHDQFVDEYMKRVSKLRLGPSLSDTTDLGPLIHERACKRVRGLLQQQPLDKDVVIKGEADDEATLFVRPKLLLNVKPNHPVYKDEVFGPICGVVPFNTEAEVVHMANDTKFGLAGYFFTQDLARASRVTRALKVGMVGVNTGLISSEVAPFGGVKESGCSTGREGSYLGMDEYSEVKYAAVQSL